MLIYFVLCFTQLIVFQGVVAFKTSLKFVLFQLNRLGSVYFVLLIVRASYADCPLYRYGKQFADLR